MNMKLSFLEEDTNSRTMMDCNTFSLRILYRSQDRNSREWYGIQDIFILNLLKFINILTWEVHNQGLGEWRKEMKKGLV